MDAVVGSLQLIRKVRLFIYVFITILLFISFRLFLALLFFRRSSFDNLLICNFSFHFVMFRHFGFIRVFIIFSRPFKVYGDVIFRFYFCSWYLYWVCLPLTKTPPRILFLTDRLFRPYLKILFTFSKKW